MVWFGLGFTNLIIATDTRSSSFRWSMPYQLLKPIDRFKAIGIPLMTMVGSSPLGSFFYISLFDGWPILQMSAQFFHIFLYCSWPVPFRRCWIEYLMNSYRKNTWYFILQLKSKVIGWPLFFFRRDVMGRIIDNCMMKYFATWILLAIASYTKLQLCLNSEMLKKQVAYLLMYCHEAMSIYDLFWPFLAHFWRFLHVQATQCKVINHCLVKAIIWWRMFLFVRRSDPIVSKNIQRSKLFNIV